MKADVLFQLFLELEDSSFDGNKYSVSSIDDMNHKIGKSNEGFPKLFVACLPSKSYTANLNTELISVENNVQCSLVDETETSTDAQFSIITLRSTDEYLCRIFFEVFYIALMTLPPLPSSSELAFKIEGMLSIFAALKKKPIHKIQGLWAELLVILNSFNPEIVAMAWHNSPGSKFDFTMGTDKIEVKSTSSEQRIHQFSIDQLNPTPSSNLLIASIVVRESAKDINGLSINDLYDRICQHVSNIDVRMHIYSVITNTLGDEFAKAGTVYFDYSSGNDSLAFFDYHDIPKICKEDIPPFVSGVKFATDLSHVVDVKTKGVHYSPETLLGSLNL